MQYTVFHAKHPNFGFGGHPEFNTDVVQSDGKASRHCDTQKDFKAVAVVEAKSVDDVFRITNHIDQSWTKNPEVVRYVGQPRSTSVGDVVVEQSGTAFRCEMAGWSKI